MSSKRKSISREASKRVASSKTYTAQGEPIRDLDAYVAAGGRPRNSAGDMIRNPKAYQNVIEASVRQNTNDPKYLYHYTNQQAAASITKSGTINASSGGLAGSGTYCTAKPPRCHPANLLSNNYASSTARDPSYVSSYVRMDADNLNAERVEDGNRDIWKVSGSVDLNQHNAFVAERHQDSTNYGGTNNQGHYYDDEYEDVCHEHQYNDFDY